MMKRGGGQPRLFLKLITLLTLSGVLGSATTAKPILYEGLLLIFRKRYYLSVLHFLEETYNS